MTTSTRSVETWRCILMSILFFIVALSNISWSIALAYFTVIMILADFLFLSYWSGRQVDYIQRRFIYIRTELEDSYSAMRRTFKERIPNSFSGEDFDTLRGVLPLAILIFILYFIFGIIPRLIFQLLWGVICMIWYFIHWAASMIFNNSIENQRHPEESPLVAIGIYSMVLYCAIGIIWFSFLLL